MKTKVHWDVMSDQDEKPNDVWHRQEETTAEGLQLLQVPADNGRTGLLPEGGSRTIYNNNINMPDEEETALLAGKYEKIAVKDFHAEIRAFRDVEDFLNRTLLLLDLQTTGLTQIVDSMLHKLHSKKDIGQTFTIEEAKQAIFTEDSVHLISKTIQGTTFTDECGFQIDQSWICIMCDLPNLTRRHVVISRLQVPANLGATSLEVRFVILVMTPTKEKSTKSALETGRTFATLFLDINFRHQLLEATTEFEFKQLLQKKTKLLIDEQGLPENRKSHLMLTSAFDDDEEQSKCPFGRGLYNDIKRRLPHYFSDFKDGIIGHKTPHKVLSTTFFLYFACVLPNMAFGMLNNNNTHGVIGVKKILFSQCVGGLLFAVFGGQPLIVLLTTAPLALYTKLIYNICEDFDLNFDAMYACVGLWNAFFLFIYVFFNLSKLMQFSSRSTEEIFSLFITFAFSADAIKDTLKDFKKNYHTPACQKSHISAVQLNLTNISVTSTVTTVAMDTVANDSAVTSSVPVYMVGECLRENSILFLLLMLGTVWTGITLYNFTKTPFLNASKREILADYALPVAVLLMSFFGSFIFRDIKLKPFEYSDSEKMFQVAPLEKLPVGAIFAAAGLGFSLSLLFFMDQNISSALVNTPTNKLKKGSAYHLDLFVVAVINGFLSVFTFPWIHAALPHSPLHVKALADLEDRIEQGHVHQVVVHVRETRLTGIISHVLIGLSMLLLPYPMAYIPRPVLDGLFLYVAITALFGNQLFDRILLLFTEQSAYPPNHYIRRVPQRKVHMFTVLQLVQLLVLCVFGFSPIPYMKMVFPVLIMLLMPIRHKLVPKVIEPKYLKALDGH